MSRLYCHPDAGCHLKEGAVKLIYKKNKKTKMGVIFKGSVKTTEDDAHTAAHETAALIADTLRR